MSTTMSGPLATERVLRSLATLLPRPPSQSTPAFIHGSDAVAALVHTINVSLGFRLMLSESENGLSEALAAGHQESEKRDDETMSETTAVNEDETYMGDQPTPGRLQLGWNGTDDKTLTYTHDQSSMKFLIKVSKVGQRISLMGMADDQEPHQFTILSWDLLNNDFFPWPKPDAVDIPSVDGAFTSEAKLRDFIERYLRDIIAKLIPNLQAEGYTEPASSSHAPPPSSQGRHPHRPGPGPEAAVRGPSSSFNPYNPRIGDRDLDPFPAVLPRPFGGGGGGLDPAAGGMTIGPEYFARRRIDDREQGPGGLINPPGARWDPVGPAIGGEGFPRVGGNPLNGQGVGDPDFDELLPPGERGPDLRMPGSGGRQPFGGPGYGGIGGMRGGFGGLGGGGGYGGGQFM